MGEEISDDSFLQVFAVFLLYRENGCHFPDFWENTILKAVLEYNFSGNAKASSLIFIIRTDMFFSRAVPKERDW